MGKVAIIGGGVAGCGVGIYLKQRDVDVMIFEKKSSLVSGPPMCHLHAGGNLYPEISLNQRLQLLKESIDFLKFFPFAIDYRPTIVSVPKDINISMKEILNALEKIKDYYKELVKKDKSNKVLGAPDEYYKIYSKEEIEKLKERKVNVPKSNEDWMAVFARNVDLDTIKYPVILVKEFGLNVFRIAASAEILLKDNFLLNTEVVDVKRVGDKWEIIYKKEGKVFKDVFDYLINAAGFESGVIDDFVGFKEERFVEFKAAYVTKWENDEKYWPEIIFLGIRGTDKGLGQFTPYPGSHFQLHYMSKNATLFEDGLVKTKDSSQPKLPKRHIEKIEKGWNFEEVEKRTKKAIEYISKFIPSFKDAKVTKVPLFGAQQIPGNDPELRAAEVFIGDRYARCEIVKASSIIEMSKVIEKELKNLGFKINNKKDLEINEKEIENLAKNLAKKRGYPEDLGQINFKRY